jgi:predicted O-methyltransferase YrrM
MSISDHELFELATLPKHSGDDMAGHLLTLYACARFLPAFTAVEIGTDDGSSTTALLAGATEIGGHLHSVDPAPCAGARKRVSEYGYAEHWTFHNCPSAVFAPSCPECIDLLFIDGDHSYNGVRADWQLFGPKVRSGGLILFHDYVSIYPGVAQLVDGVIRPDWLAFECVTLPWSYGLTIVRKR